MHQSKIIICVHWHIDLKIIFVERLLLLFPGPMGESI
jgi:hypothetical protein